MYNKILSSPLKLITICGKSCISAVWVVFECTFVLRYYATFKVRKWVVFYKSNTCLQKATTCIGLQAEQIFSIKKGFLCYFQKLQLHVVEKFWTNFCCIVVLHLWAQKKCLRLIKSYFKLEILIFLSFVVSFLVDMFN